MGFQSLTEAMKTVLSYRIFGNGPSISMSAETVLWNFESQSFFSNMIVRMDEDAAALSFLGTLQQFGITVTGRLFSRNHIPTAFDTGAINRFRVIQATKCAITLDAHDDTYLASSIQPLASRLNYLRDDCIREVESDLAIFDPQALRQVVIVVANSLLESVSKFHWHDPGEYDHDFRAVVQKRGRNCCKYRSAYPIINLRGLVGAGDVIDLRTELQRAFDKWDIEQLMERVFNLAIVMRGLLRQSRTVTLDQLDKDRALDQADLIIQEPEYQRIEEIRAEIKLTHIDQLLEQLENINGQFELWRRYIGWDEEEEKRRDEMKRRLLRFIAIIRHHLQDGTCKGQIELLSSTASLRLSDTYQSSLTLAPG